MRKVKGKDYCGSDFMLIIYHFQWAYDSFDGFL